MKTTYAPYHGATTKAFEYRTLVCVAGACGCEHARVSDYSWFRPEAALALLSGAIHHHMTFCVDSLSQDEKRAWLLTFYTLAEAEQAVRQ